MHWRRLAGTILGILVGFFPFFNTLVCAVLSFIQKKPLRGIFFLLLLGILVPSARHLATADAQRKILATEWLPAFERSLESTVFSRETLYHYTAFEQKMLEVVKKTIVDLVPGNPELDPFFEFNAKTGEPYLGNQSYGYLTLASRRIHTFYMSRVNEKIGEAGEVAARKMPFGKTPEEKEYIAQRMDIFIKSYADYRLGWGEGACYALMAIVFFFSFPGCILMMRRMFDNVAAAPLTSVASVASVAPVTSFSSVPLTIPHNSIADTVNINTANEREMTSLPGINQILAKAIVGERRRNGHFLDVFDLEERMGFSEDVTARLMFTTSFDVNTANNNVAPERWEEPPGREEPPKREDPPNKRKDNGTGGGRRVEF